MLFSVNLFGRILVTFADFLGSFLEVGLSVVTEDITRELNFILRVEAVDIVVGEEIHCCISWCIGDV